MQLHISLPFSRYLTLKNCDLEIQVKTYSSYESVHRLYIAEIDRPRSYLVCRGSSMVYLYPYKKSQKTLYMVPTESPYAISY